jgi:hypothetical protein
LTVVTDPIGTCADGSIPSLPLAVVENRMLILVVPGINHTAGVRPLGPALLSSYIKCHNHREMEKIAPIGNSPEWLDVKSHSVVLWNSHLTVKLALQLAQLAGRAWRRRSSASGE